MSQAGARSSRGDEYQLRIAMRWLVRLWTDSEVSAVHVESLGMPGDQKAPLVDDVVVEFTDGRRVYVQAKKNHPDFATWSLRDETMKDELLKARDQLERDLAGAQSLVHFVSRSPFGALHKLAEGVRDYTDCSVFLSEAPQTQTGELNRLAQFWERDAERSFHLAQRLYFEVTSDYEELDRDVMERLRMLFARPEEVRDRLEERLRSQQSRLRDPVAVFRRSDLERELAKNGHVPSPFRSVADQLAVFARSSQIGRPWVREVAGLRFPRSETREILKAIDAGATSVVVVGEPGIGKTCVLLDVVDQLEADPSKALLFIKGDRYGGAESEQDLINRGLPDDIVGRCSHLSVERPVVVVLDALDVLSLQRSGGTLALFLGLLDRLATIPGVTVVAACRSFDLKFDPKLRARTWASKVTVWPLDVEEAVIPALSAWGVNKDELDPELVELLRVPGRLWLYGQILERTGPLERVRSLYELHDRYLESVEQEAGWGESAMALLERIASRMQETRSMEIGRTEVSASVDVLQGLLSRGTLRETERGYAFAHQELLDVVAVRASRRRGETLRAFVASRPALPFLRPTIRVYLHVLRAGDARTFRREVWELLDDEAIAYHLRRLVAETLAELVLAAEDLPLLRRLSQNHGDLFVRFLRSTSAERWVEVMVNDVLPMVEQDRDGTRLTKLVMEHLFVWAGARPDVILPAWQRFLSGRGDEGLALTYSFAEVLESALKSARHALVPWDAAEWLLRHLLSATSGTEDGPYMIGRAIEAWCDAGGDEGLLLDYLNFDGSEASDDEDRRLERRLRSLGHYRKGDDASEQFLALQIATSDIVAQAVLSYVLRYAGKRRGWRRLLDETSWRARHNRGIMGHETINSVLTALESGLRTRAARNDSWWQQHERDIVTHTDPGVRYLALQVYMRDPERHTKAIAALLTDPSTYTYTELESEARELAHAAYPYLDNGTSSAHQALVLSLALPQDGDDDSRKSYRQRRAYGHLIWIPRCFWGPEASAFIEAMMPKLGPWRPEATIYMSSGFVSSPVSSETLQGLSDSGILSVIRFWGTSLSDSDSFTERTGGWDMVAHSVQDAAMNDPVRALRWLNMLLDEGAPPPYLNACIEGMAFHLRARFGGLGLGDRWSPLEPLPQGEALAEALLVLLERYAEDWIKEHVLAESAQACVHVRFDSETAARVIPFLTRLGHSQTPDGSTGGSPSMLAFNSVQGQAALAAIELAGRLAEEGRELPDDLVELLTSLVAHESPGVRWAILQGLPFLSQGAPEFAWRLLGTPSPQATQEEWTAIERCLYYHYHGDFDRVRPVLGLIRASSFEKAGGTYGRITALAFLSGHLDETELFGGLEAAPLSVWDGVADVLAGNLGDTAQGAKCEAGLRRLLTMAELPAEVVKSILHDLGRDALRPHFSQDVIYALLDQISGEAVRTHAVSNIVEWAAEKVASDVTGVLAVLERLVEKLGTDYLPHLYASDELVVALTVLLREADETDDGTLIERVLQLQDRLLSAGIRGIDQMLDMASRP